MLQVSNSFENHDGPHQVARSSGIVQARRTFSFGKGRVLVLVKEFQDIKK
jgi:hypothetical protein